MPRLISYLLRLGAPLAMVLVFAIPPSPQNVDALPGNCQFPTSRSACPRQGDTWMPQTDIPFDYRMQYLSGGVNTGGGWETWNSNGTFALSYANESAQHNYSGVSLLRAFAKQRLMRQLFREPERSQQSEQRRHDGSVLRELRAPDEAAWAGPTWHPGVWQDRVDQHRDRTSAAATRSRRRTAAARALASALARATTRPCSKRLSIAPALVTSRRTPIPTRATFRRWRICATSTLRTCCSGST